MQHMKVWRPDGSTVRVAGIANDADHFGNLVHEGALAASDYWPSMAASAARDAGRWHARWLGLRNSCEAEAYAAGWVQRWIDDTQRDSPLSAGRMGRANG